MILSMFLAQSGFFLLSPESLGRRGRRSRCYCINFGVFDASFPSAGRWTSGDSFLLGRHILLPPAIVLFSSN